MGLRDRAEAEVADDQRQAEERKAQEVERSEMRHSEKAKVPAEWLAEWSGEPVTPNMLTERDYPGFHPFIAWAVTIDGFDLLLKDSGPPPSSDDERTFELMRVREDGSLTRVERPADLLHAEPIEG
jgi:hypothetical protein